MSSTPKKRKLLFLYSELAEYFLACLRELSKTGHEIHVFHFPINPEAPFSFDFPAGVKFYDVQQFPGKKLDAMVQRLQPDYIYSSGWIYKPYIRICKSSAGKIPTVLALDTPFKGTFKQYLATLAGPFLKSIFSHCWAAGKRQHKYARKLGFREAHIQDGVYSADTTKFSSLFEKNIVPKKKHFPKAFLFVGRYNTVKDIQLLLQVYKDNSEKLSGWKLNCAGTGELGHLLKNIPGVTDFGFVQPQKMADLIAESGVFILPSIFEPWGVALHEFAAAGMPIIASDEVGATEKYLQDKENGFLFESGNAASLLTAMLSITKSTDMELQNMGEKSARLGASYNTQKWSQNVLSLLDDK